MSRDSIINNELKVNICFNIMHVGMLRRRKWTQATYVLKGIVVHQLFFECSLGWLLTVAKIIILKKWRRKKGGGKVEVIYFRNVCQVVIVNI
jgi:hypothetical protein